MAVLMDPGCVECAGLPAGVDQGDVWGCGSLERIEKKKYVIG